jgi:hypothetical protein
MIPFRHPILPCHVSELIDFSGGDSSLEHVKSLQEEGVAGLYNILCRGRFAFLADEVGMGKTFQAIGLAALLWHVKPDARVVFITPRQILQKQWEQDLRVFFDRNYESPNLHADHGTAPWEEKVNSFENLRDFAKVLHERPRACILRHTSFTRPIFDQPRRLDEISSAWDRACALMRELGLPLKGQAPRVRGLEEVGREFNKQFARGLNARLRSLQSGAPIDLLVVDEAQMLRHRDNQTNTIFANVFDGIVEKWLFLSATPLHSGRQTIKAITDYADESALSKEDLDPTTLPVKMKRFLVRRPRSFQCSIRGQVTKRDYREHRQEKLDGSKGVPGLAMALVQKNLAALLESQNNRYQVGFLTSFESLQQSAGTVSTKPVSSDETDEPSTPAGSDDDLSRQAEFTQRGKSQPDALRIRSLGESFARDFAGEHLPHPKLDEVARLVAQTAFDEGEKVIVFMRRIAAVKEFCDHIERAFSRRIEDRIRTHWGDIYFDWKRGPTLGEQAAGDIATAEEARNANVEDASVSDESGLRLSRQQGEWLHRYRRTFEGSGRNSLFFEENWLLLLASLYGQDSTVWANAVPDEVWRQAASSTGDRRLSPGQRRNYIIVKMLQKHPASWNLTPEVASAWADVLSSLYNYVVGERSTQGAGPRELDLLLGEGFWEILARMESSWWSGLISELQPETMGLSQKIFLRQITKNWISQNLRSSDALIDLLYAEGRSQAPADTTAAKRIRNFALEFVRWLWSDHIDAIVQRKRLARWSLDREVIYRACFAGRGEVLAKRAAVGSDRELDNPQPVVGIVGGSDIGERAILQFKSPGYPQVLVCTDVLKEGANLHTFCDRVVHYGIAWTAGDLEQRIGRVDRFQSQIERRLRSSAGVESPKLNITYPYVDHTLEQRQVSHVLSMVSEAEHIMDDLHSENGERWHLSASPDASPQKVIRSNSIRGNFAPSFRGVRGRSLVKAP